MPKIDSFIKFLPCNIHLFFTMYIYIYIFIYRNMKIPYINIYFKSLYLSTYDSISGAVARYRKVHAFHMQFLGVFLSRGDELLNTFKQDSVDI